MIPSPPPPDAIRVSSRPHIPARLTHAFVVAAAVAALVHGAGGVLSAQAASPGISFFKNYFVTGDYAVGGVSLWQRGVNGTASAKIVVPAYDPATQNGVPPGADLIAAFLYVQTAEATKLPGSGIHHATFNGNDLGPGDNSLGVALTGGGSVQPCWSVAFPGGRQLLTYRFDVMRFLPLDAQNKLAAGGPHIVSVPDIGSGLPEEGGTESGDPGPRALGASLVIVYRDSAKPLRSIVIYDGAATKRAFDTFTLPVAGFYQAAAAPQARITPIVGDGRPFLGERLLVNGTAVAANVFGSTSGAKWDNPTIRNLPVPPGSGSLTLQIRPDGLIPDCLTPSAVVFSTAVQDSDEDGLLDLWESSTTPIVDPKGRALPPLNAMGADPLVKDAFIEVGYMATAGATSYGGVVKPQHSHRPGPEALQMIGDAFRGSAATPRVRLHFDIGPWAGSTYDTPAVSQYLVPNAHARGGEAIDERATVCTPLPGDPPWVCQFSEHPGTVGWKSGFRFLRDEVLAIAGPTLPPPGTDPEEYCDLPGNSCTRRFDENRLQTFRYALFAHALGLPKSELPCLQNGLPVDGDAAGACPAPLTRNPEFRTPRTNTGIGDFPGADMMVTLGAFPDVNGLPVGTPFMQASTLMHEMGHGLERRHGGEAFEPNCKPTYLSVMNYLYQLRGLLDDAGTQHLDFSSNLFSYPTIDETALADGFVAALPYRIGWYAPLATSYLAGRTNPVARHCDGSLISGADALTVPMVRIDARTAASPFDWNANGVLDTPSTPPLPSGQQDVNFNGRLDPQLRGSDDWSNVKLNQIGSRRNVGALYVPIGAGPNEFAVGPLSVDVGKGDLGKGDLGKRDLGKGDLGKGDLGKGDLGKGDLGKGDLGKGDLGKGDLGGGDLFENDPNNPSGELDFETATFLAKTPPNEFAACVVGVNCVAGDGDLHDIRATWSAPTVGGVSGFTLYRVDGPVLLPGQTWVTVATVAAVNGATLYSSIDTSSLVNGAQYTFFVVATYADGTRSDPSNLVTITAVNDPPQANDDAYVVSEDALLTVPAPGVLANDADPDSPGPATFTATLVAGPSSAVAFTLNQNGSFSYRPAANFSGTDTFVYSIGADTATVTITVNAVNDAPTIAPVPLASRTIEANSSTGPIAFTIGDAEGLAGLNVSASSSNLALVPLANIVLGGSGANRTVTVTPAPNHGGSATITVTVSDGTASASTTLLLTVKLTQYKFVAVANLPPVKTKAGATTSMSWQYFDGKTLVNSSALNHAITVCRVTATGCTPVDTLTNTDAGGSSFRYSGGKWTFNLQTKDRSGAPYAPGEYRLTIVPNNSQYQSGGPYVLTITR